MDIGVARLASIDARISLFLIQRCGSEEAALARGDLSGGQGAARRSCPAESSV
jgi:hypothetical protein